MRLIKTTLIYVLAVFSMIIAPYSSYAEAPANNEKMLPMLTTQLNSMLPLEVQKGMTFESVNISDNNTVIEMHLLLDPEKTGLGVTAKEYKESLEQMTPEQINELMGKDLNNTFKGLGLKARAILKLPDGYKRVIEIK